MGTHNRISEKDYKFYKKLLRKPSDDTSVIEKYGISETSCRNIRNTKNYQEYCERVFRFHNHPKGKVALKKLDNTLEKQSAKTSLDAILLVLGAIATLVSIVGILQSDEALRPLWLVMLIISIGISAAFVVGRENE